MGEGRFRALQLKRVVAAKQPDVRELLQRRHPLWQPAVQMILSYVEVREIAQPALAAM